MDGRLRTSNRRIFAAGDIWSKYKFTHAADLMARRKLTDLVIPWCTYTDPEIAHVGFYEKDTRAAGYDVATISEPDIAAGQPTVDCRRTDGAIQ